MMQLPTTKGYASKLCVSLPLLLFGGEATRPVIYSIWFYFWLDCFTFITTAFPHDSAAFCL